VLHEAGLEFEAESTGEFRYTGEDLRDWRSIDRALRTIARRRAALDADEARWLREAEAQQIWRPLGMVSALDYMERVLGYGPRAAQERLRVARALGTLPQLTAALADGELPFSAVRELTRVATPATEDAWRTAATGKNLRQIEELVADHRPGDRPDAPPDPEARTHVVRFELSAETFALLRQARGVLDDERGNHLSDDQFVATLCGSVLDGAPATEPTGRAKFQVAVTVCARCRQGWQDGAGARVPISPAAIERAACDAQHIGSIDGATPERASQDVPPSVARLVWRRDARRCRVPGCRSSRGLEIHHLVRRVDGGSHDASNLILACSACHMAHHNGFLTITGTADHLEVHRRGEPSPIATVDAHVGASIKLDVAILRTEPEEATRRPSEPNSVATVDAHVGAPTSLGLAVLRTQSKDMDRRPTEPRSVATLDAYVGAPTKLDAAIRHTQNIEAAHRPTEPRSVAALAAHVGASTKLDVAVLRTHAKEALIGLGWKAAVATAAVAAASAALGAETTLERMIFEALRRCPRPTC
jgi:hypothetical protein